MTGYDKPKPTEGPCRGCGKPLKEPEFYDLCWPCDIREIPKVTWIFWLVWMLFSLAAIVYTNPDILNF